VSYDTPIPPEKQELIDQLFEVRVLNNIPWKRLMEIAIEAEPNLTREVLQQIEANDRIVSDLMRKLTK
jgi:hypothetical protein